MNSYTELINRAATLCGLDPTRENSDLDKIKSDINLGIAQMRNTSRVPWAQKTFTTNLVAQQQDYQLPPDCIRPSTVQVLTNGFPAQLPLEPVGSQMEWNEINMWPTVSYPWPAYYFVKGHNQISLWPMPGHDKDNGLILIYEQKTPVLAIQDITSKNNSYTSSNPGTNVTANVNNGSADIVFSQPIMTGVPNNNLYFMTTDGSDGNIYKIAEINNPTTITLEQIYQAPGNSSSSAKFRIGQMADFPDEIQLAPAYFAAAQYYSIRKDEGTAQNLLAQFNMFIDMYRKNYGVRGTSRVSRNNAPGAINAWQWIGLGQNAGSGL